MKKRTEKAVEANKGRKTETGKGKKEMRKGNEDRRL